MKKVKTTAEQAEHAIIALKKIRFLLQSGKISYDAAKEFAAEHIVTFNSYSDKKINFTHFMR